MRGVIGASQPDRKKQLYTFVRNQKKPRLSIHGPIIFHYINMLNTTCRNALKRLRIAWPTCVLWIDGIEVGTWLCICKGGSSIGILLKIRCKTKCDKTLPARKVYMRKQGKHGYLHWWIFKIQYFQPTKPCKKNVTMLQVNKDFNTFVWRCRM